MARGVKKPIEEKIREKREVIAGLKRRIQKENEELEELLKQERDQNLEVLNEFLTEAHLTPKEATELLKAQVKNGIKED